MEIIIKGRLIITNDPKLIREFAEEGVGRNVVGGLKTRRSVVEGLVKKFGQGEANKRPDEISFGYGIGRVGGLGELNRRSGRERQ